MKWFKKFSYIVKISLMSTIAFSMIANTSGIKTSPSDNKRKTKVLCMPGIFMNPPSDCIPAGSSDYLTEMANVGISFPLLPLPARQADPELAQIDVYYAEVRTPNAPVYGSLEDAIAHKRKSAVNHINAGFAYISYQTASEIDGKRYYNTSPGAWMTAADVSRIGVLPRFQGMAFYKTPGTSFGWVLAYLSPEPVETKHTPGNQIKDYTGHSYKNHDIVQIYDVRTVNEKDWYLVGPDEWLSDRVVAKVTPNTVPPEGVENGRWIEVNLKEQTLAVYDNQKLVFATLIASGMEPFWTRPGLFQIREKLEKTPMRGAAGASSEDAYYLEDVPWTMYFDDARALHGAYWRAKLGFPQSHGCINMTIGDAHWLFNWANVGDWVYVWDPSGQTPTDPNLYGSGAF